MSKRLDRSGPNFVDAQNYKNVCPKVLGFRKILKCAKKILLNPRIFFLLLYIVQSEDAQIEILSK